MSKAQQWIPCSERLPKQNVMVIVCCYGSDLVVPDYENGETFYEALERDRNTPSVSVGMIGTDGWYGADWFPMMVQPTFWMPLPEPPEGGTSNG
jgi:hypothetical protein